VSDELAYVSVYRGIAVFDLRIAKVTEIISLDLPCSPDEMTLSSSKLLYVSACKVVVAIDTTSNSVLGESMQFEKSIYDIAVTPNGYLYTLHHDSISVVDPIDRRVVTNIKLDQCQAEQLVATEYGKVFVTCYNKLVVAIDTSSNNVLSSSSLPCRCFQIATIHNGNLYLFDLGAENVVVLDAESGELVTEISRSE
jgi:DNA-binding beta-propeller fold protein YncE